MPGPPRRACRPRRRAPLRAAAVAPRRRQRRAVPAPPAPPRRWRPPRCRPPAWRAGGGRGRRGWRCVQQVIQQQMQLMRSSSPAGSRRRTAPRRCRRRRRRPPTAQWRRRRRPPATASSVPPAASAPAAGAAAAGGAGRRRGRAALGPVTRTTSRRPSARSPASTPAGLELTRSQRARLDAFMRRYVARTPKSKAYTTEHRPHLADPRVVNGFRPLTEGDRLPDRRRALARLARVGHRRQRVRRRAQWLRHQPLRLAAGIRDRRRCANSWTPATRSARSTRWPARSRGWSAS
jgi:hypothetical protein